MTACPHWASSPSDPACCVQASQGLVQEANGTSRGFAAQVSSLRTELENTAVRLSQAEARGQGFQTTLKLTMVKLSRYAAPSFIAYSVGSA